MMADREPPEPDRPSARTRAVDRLRNASGVLPRLAEARLRHREGERALRDALGDILAEGAIEIGFQPIVELSSRQVVGWEALARGPLNTPLRRPDRLFEIARAARRTEELDWLCQRRALNGVLAAGPSQRHALFLNMEPDSTGFMPLELRTLFGHATAEVTVAVEVTERATMDRPAALLGHVADMRALGCAIALDDVGTQPGSLAMMAVLAPEVVKLDLEHLSSLPEGRLDEIIVGVKAQAADTGATLGFERIERPEQVELAIALGGRLGQGFLFGRRGPLEEAPPAGDHRPVTPVWRPDPRDEAPYALVTPRHAPREAGLDEVRGLARALEEEARAAGDEAVLIAAVGEDANFTPWLRERYAGLARDVCFCGVVGRGLATEPALGVRGGPLSAADRLVGERSIAVVTPRFATVLAAHDLGPEEPPERRISYVVSRDRDLATAAAAALMSRIAG
jgi:EAL domain-containing protein (putative c-di-GMP-specific phosphodiesterase class I)